MLRVRRALGVTALTALAAASVAGCTIHDACANGTVLVALTLSGATADADQLVIDIALDGGAARESVLRHAAGGASGNIVVQFPSGYPHGHTLAVTVTARVAGGDVGVGTISVALSSGCEAVTLAIAPSVVDDLAMALDIAQPLVDMAQCIPTTENCFDGIDNDCDGHIDCDDSDCTSTAVCVPAVTGSFAVGTTVDPLSFCPGVYTSQAIINSGILVAPNCFYGCGCGTTCLTTLYYFFGGGCPNTDNENSLSQVDNKSCHSWNAPPWNGTLDVHQLATPASCSQTGAPVLPDMGWAATKRVCTTALHGGGCAAGKICVPVTPAQNCEVAAGAQTCDIGYTLVNGPWYTGLNDTRGCSCSCGAPTGNCGTAVDLYTDTGCSSGDTQFSATMSNNINCSVGTTFRSAKVLANPTCGAPTYNPQTGSLSGSGEQTLCCAN